MRCRNKISGSYLVFSKWTRKRYAAFASLGKLIKIARLSVDTFKSLLSENKPIQLLLDTENNKDEVFNEALDDNIASLEEMKHQLFLVLQHSKLNKAYFPVIKFINWQSPYFT